MNKRILPKFFYCDEVIVNQPNTLFAQCKREIINSGLHKKFNSTEKYIFEKTPSVELDIVCINHRSNCEYICYCPDYFQRFESNNYKQLQSHEVLAVFNTPIETTVKKSSIKYRVNEQKRNSVKRKLFE